MNYSGAAGGGSRRAAEFLYDPKLDIVITFKKETIRKDVIAWLLKNNIYGHMLTGVLKKKKSVWEIGLISEECLENLVKKCQRAVDIVEDYECMKPLETKVIFSSVPGAFPDDIIKQNITIRVGKIQKALIEKNRDDGIPTGRRFYWLKTADLEANPIAERIKIGGRIMWTYYPQQPVICFKCKQTGHMSTNCTAEKVKETAKEDMAQVIERNDEQNEAEENKNNKRRRATTGETPDGKKREILNDLPVLTTAGIDSTNMNDITWRTALDTAIPHGITPPRGAGLKECAICNNHLITGQTDSGLIIARCTCNNDTRADVSVKCIAENCREWIRFPKQGERTICKCGCNVYICKCNCLHTVPGTQFDYECVNCNEPSDPIPDLRHV